MTLQFFISYSRVDKPFIEGFVSRLRKIVPRANLWYDDELLGGDDWWDEILNQIAQCDIFIYLLSNESVSSPYCQAEFNEARRLQKRIITVQVRDRTQLTDQLKDIQYVDMKAGINDSDAVARLAGAINKQRELVKKRRPLWQPRTPKPSIPQEKPRIAEAPEVDTPPLDSPKSVSDPQIRSAWVTMLGGGIFVLIAAVIGLVPFFTTQIQNSQSTQTALALIASTTDIPSLTPTFQETSTSSTTFATDIVPLVTDINVTAYEQLTLSARETDDVVGTRSIENQTATATLWTHTPSPTIIPTQTVTSTKVVTQVLPTHTEFEKAFEHAQARMTSNSQWQTLYPDGFVQDFNGVPMVLVPTGCFLLGANPQQENEQNGNEICFDEPFWIDQTEVSQEQFQRFNGVARYTPLFSGGQRPVETITWVEARNFCEQRDTRLPTEVEWEYAARGPDQLDYPWGNELIPNNVIWLQTSNNETGNVGSIEDGASWIGALDMSGNVWEWVSSLYLAYPYSADHENENSRDIRVLRGGSWTSSNSIVLRSAYRRDFHSNDSSNYVGFRCARDID